MSYKSETISLYSSGYTSIDLAHNHIPLFLYSDNDYLYIPILKPTHSIFTIYKLNLNSERDIDIFTNNIPYACSGVKIDSIMYILDNINFLYSRPESSIYQIKPNGIFESLEVSGLNSRPTKIVTGLKSRPIKIVTDKTYIYVINNNSNIGRLNVITNEYNDNWVTIDSNNNYLFGGCYKNNILYVNDVIGNIHKIDITDPNNPILIQNWVSLQKNTDSSDTGSNICYKYYDIDIDGTYLYVAQGSSECVENIDHSNFGITLIDLYGNFLTSSWLTNPEDVHIDSILIQNETLFMKNDILGKIYSVPIQK